MAHEGCQEVHPLYIVHNAGKLSTDRPTQTWAVVNDVVAEGGGETPVAIFVDTFSAFRDGDENSVQDMSSLIDAARQWIEDFPGVAVFLIHHSGKDESKGMRGSSAILGTADTVVKVDLAYGVVTVEPTKQRDFPMGSSLRLRVGSLQTDTTDKGLAITAAFLSYMGDTAQQTPDAVAVMGAERKLTSKKHWSILNLIRFSEGEELTEEDLMDKAATIYDVEAKNAKTSMKKALASLAKAGLIKEVAGQWRAMAGPWLIAKQAAVEAETGDGFSRTVDLDVKGGKR